MTNVDKNLAKEIAYQLAKLSTSKMVTSTGIALMCGYDTKSSAVYEVINTPGFPEPVQLVEGGKKRWYREEVENWLESRAAHPIKKPYTQEERVELLKRVQNWGY